MSLTKTPQADSPADVPPLKRAPREEFPRASGEVHYRVNWRLAVYTLGFLLLAGAGLYFWHGYQLRRTANAFLVRADEYEKESAWHSAARMLQQYLALQPDDVDVRIRHVKNYHKGAKSINQKSRAAELYAVACAERPEDVDLRQRQMELQYDLGQSTGALARLSLARSSAEELLRSQPGDAVALRIRAMSWHAQELIGPSPEIGESLRQAYEAALAVTRQGPDSIPLYSNAAEVLRVNLSDPEAADALMEAMVVNNPEMARARLARYAYRVRFGLPDADQDLDQALVLDNEHGLPELYLVAAERAIRSSPQDLPNAEQYYRVAVSVDPQNVSGHLGLGRVLAARGELEAALEVWREGEQKAGSDDLRLAMQITYALMGLGRLQEARDSLAKLQEGADRLAQFQSSADHDRVDGRVLALKGELEMRELNYALAIETLGLALVKLGASVGNRDADVQGRIHTCLGTSCAALQRYAKAATHFEAAARLQPGSSAAHINQAAALEQSGQLEEAIALYQEIAAGESVPASVWGLLARAVFRREQSLPADRRSLNNTFVPLLERAQRAQPESTEVRLLTAEYLVETHAIDEAANLMEVLEKLPDLTGEQRERLVVNYERMGRPEAADRLMNAVLQRRGNSAATLALHAALLAQRGKFDEAEKVFVNGLAKVPAGERPELEFRRALFRLVRGDRDEATAMLQRLAASSTPDPRALRILAEMSLEKRDFAAAEQWETALARLEDEPKIMSKMFRAERLAEQSAELLAQASGQDPKVAEDLLRQADELQNELETLRPYWSRPVVLKGRLAQLLGKHDVAIESLKAAIDLGESRIAVFYQLVKLLYQQNELLEADAVLDRLRQMATKGGMPAELGQLGMLLDLRQGNPEGAVENAKADVAANAQDSSALVRLGQALMFVKPPRPEEAEQNFRRATEVDPANSRAWFALVSFLARQSRPDEARQSFELMSQRAQLSDEERPYLFAQCQELLGDRAAADQFYGRAVDLNPNHVGVHQRAALFYYRDEPARAETALRRVLRLRPTSNTSRRMLALLIFDRGGASNHQEAVKLMEDVVASQDATNRRMLAWMKNRLGDRQGARTILADLEDAQDVDKFSLARLYEAEGDLVAARRELLALASATDALPIHVAAFVDFLLRTQQHADAGVWIERLKVMDPPERSYLATQLIARWLKTQRRDGEIVPLAERYLATSVPELKTDQDIAVVRARMGQMLSTLGFDTEAEIQFRQLPDLADWGYRVLATWLASHGKTAEAVQICLARAAADTTVEPALTLAAVLSIGSPSETDLQAAEPTLASALDQYPENTDLKFAVGTLRLMQDDEPRAVGLFRSVLLVNPRHLSAMNNLAWILGKNAESRAEALQLVNDAIDLVGASSELYDTKAWVLLQQGQLKEAEELLRQAVSDPNPDPRHLLRLAETCLQQAKEDDARRFLAQAQSQQLKVAALTREEREVLTRLEQRLR